MKINNNAPPAKKTTGRAYVFITFFLVITGFGQMPIFKRYYIADIPGLGWLGEFFVTHYLHYMFATAFFAFAAYLVANHLFLNQEKIKITVSGYIRGIIIFGLFATGLLLVFRNFASVRFSPNFITFLDLAHVLLVMVFLLTSLACLVFKWKWVKNTSRL